MPCPCNRRARTLQRVDNGVPPTSKRAGSRTSGGGVVKPPDAKGVPSTKSGAAKADGNGSTRRGPVDPRTEDPSSPAGISRAGKTVSRRPGALTPRTAKHRESGSSDAPIDFSVGLPLEHATPEAPGAVDAEPVALGPTVEFFAQGASTFTPTFLVPTTPAPTELVPEEQPRVAVPIPAPAPILYDEAASIDDVTKIGPVLDTRPLHRPVQFRRAPKPRVRRVTRVVRHVDTWSVFKVALVFNVFFYAVALVAGVLLWQVAYATGTIDNIEKFFEGFGWETFNFNGGQIFHNAWIAGLFVAVGLTGLAVLLATLFNLITDLVGGVRLSVLEEEVQARAERGIELVLDDPAPAVVSDQQMIADRQMIDGQNFETMAPGSNGEAIAG
ncbi:MAG: hypothetical protein QOJ66_99 [Ilumatobacteraceae bacterium]